MFDLFQQNYFKSIPLLLLYTPVISVPIGIWHLRLVFFSGKVALGGTRMWGYCLSTKPIAHR
jgi:hypothetical protein